MYSQGPKYPIMRQAMARQSFLMGSPMQVRLFSSLPSHIKLEMPNLSPTMEKVSHLFHNLLNYLLYRETLVHGLQLLEIRLNQEMLFVELRLIKQLLISKCKKKDISLKSYSQKIPKIFHLEPLLLFSLKMLKILLLLQITNLTMHQLLLLQQPLHQLSQKLPLQLHLLQLLLLQNLPQLNHQVVEFSLLLLLKI